MEKVAYLTIDDAPSRDMKNKIDFLLSRKTSAVWFCEGKFLKERPDFAIYTIKRGVL